MAVEVQPVQVGAKWWTKRWAQNAALLLLAILGVYGLIYWDVVSRAREAYEEAEKHVAWHHDPQLKNKHFSDQFENEKAKLDRLLQKKEISEEEYRQKLDVFEFDRQFSLEESSLKYAYQWYKDTYELFSPPESKWVRMARAKAPQTLELWKQELRAKNVPFEDYMFE